MRVNVDTGEIRDKALISILVDVEHHNTFKLLLGRSKFTCTHEHAKF